MKNSIFLKLVLAIDSLVAIAVGAMIQISPADFYAMNHINIGTNLNLLSEIRAPAMALLSYGILILAGIFIPRLTFTATLLASMFYLSYGVARVVSMGIDGLPSESLITAAIIEIVLGLVSLFCLWKYILSPNLESQELPPLNIINIGDLQAPQTRTKAIAIIGVQTDPTAGK